MRQGILLSIIVAVMVLGLAPALGARAAWEITVAEGDLLLLPGEEVDWRIIAPAEQLRLGDRLWAAPAGRAAVAGPAGLQLRLDHGTQVQRVADSESQIFAMLSGAIYVKHPDIGHEGMAFVLTAGYVSFRSETPTIMRVDLLEEEGIVSVAIHKGEVLVKTALDNVWLHSGERADVMRTGVIEGPKSILLTDRDAFDEWNEEQELRLVRREPLSDDAEPDLAQLDDYGNWVQVATYGRVWRPQVAGDWQPYFYGQWVWVSSYGWSWISAEPWGWLPSHYGQWVWDSFYGWVWIPGYTWAPAWVIWTPYQGGWAWAPYGPFAIPISIVWHYWCWTVDVGQAGWQHHRPVGKVPPPAYSHRVGDPKRQPPHRAGGDRARTEEAARVKPARLERGNALHPSDHQGGTINRLPSVERRNGRVAELQKPSRESSGQHEGLGHVLRDPVDPALREDPGQVHGDGGNRSDDPSTRRSDLRERSERTLRDDSGQALRNHSGQALREGSEQALRNGSSGQAARPGEERRQTEPGRDVPTDRLNRASRQPPAGLDESSPRSNRSTQPAESQSGRRMHAAEGPAVRDAPRDTVVRRSDSSGDGGRRSQIVERPPANNEAQPSGGFSWRGGAAGPRSD